MTMPTRLHLRFGLLLLIAISSATSASEIVKVPFGPKRLMLALTHETPRTKERSASPVLLIHGASFPTSNASGWRGSGESWISALAKSGHDVWALDFLGYGASDRYPEMLSNAEVGEPLSTVDDMVAQVAQAIESIRTKQTGARVVLIAHSAGTFVAAKYATEHPDRVAGVVLFGAPMPGAPDATVEVPKERYFDMTPEEQWSSFEDRVKDTGMWTRAEALRWGEAWLSSDPTSGTRSPPSVRVPYAMVAAYESMRRSGTLPYDPKQIMAPTLLVVGEWDAIVSVSDETRLLESIGSDDKRLVVIGRSGHRSHLEKHRDILFAETAGFVRSLP